MASSLSWLFLLFIVGAVVFGIAGLYHLSETNGQYAIACFLIMFICVGLLFAVIMMATSLGVWV
jgi:hypothetical protein